MSTDAIALTMFGAMMALAADRAADVRHHRLRRHGRGDPALGRPGRLRPRLRAVDQAHGLVPASHPADVHLHGLRAFRKPAGRRSLPDVPRLVRAGPRRACHRDDPPDGPDLGDEWAFGRGHGDRRDDRAAGASETQLRQADGHRRDPGGIVPRHPRAALGGPCPLRDDRAPAGRQALARRACSRAS